MQCPDSAAPHDRPFDNTIVPVRATPPAASGPRPGVVGGRVRTGGPGRRAVRSVAVAWR
jgi:hypothetical protein